MITKAKTKIKKISTKSTKIKPKPRGEVIPKLEIEKPHPRKLPVPMPPMQNKKPKTAAKKTATKKAATKMKPLSKSVVSKKGWITRRKNAKK